MSTAPHRIRRRPGWLGVIGTSVAIFLVVLALLWVRLSAGEDPVLGAQATPSAQVTSSSDTGTSSDDTTSSGDTASSSSSSSSSTSSDTPTTHAS